MKAKIFGILADTGDHAPSHFSEGPFRTLLAIEALVGLVLAFLYLGNKSLAGDEGFTFNFIVRDWSSLFRLIAKAEMNQGLYYVLLKAWLVFGNSEFLLRVPSAVFAAAAVATTATLGRHLYDRRVGLTAGLIIAINPFLLQYAQEARGYTLMLFLVSLSSLFFVRMMQEGSPWNSVLYIIVTTLAVYAHLFAVLVVSAHLASLSALPPKSARWRTIALCLGVFIVLFIPIGLFLLTTNEPGPVYAEPPSGIVDLINHLASLSGGRGLLIPYFAFSAVEACSSLITLIRKGRSKSGWPQWFAMSWLIVPTATAFIASYFKPMFVSKFLIFTLPPLALLVAAGIWRTRPKSLSVVGTCLLLLLAMRSVSGYYNGTWGKKSDWRAATIFILEQSRPGDVIVFNPWWTRTCYDYYVSRLGNKHFSPKLIPYHMSEFEFIGDGFANIAHDRLWRESLRKAFMETSHERVWVVLSPYSKRSCWWCDPTDITDAFKSHLAVGVRREFYKKIQVVLYE